MTKTEKKTGEREERDRKKTRREKNKIKVRGRAERKDKRPRERESAKPALNGEKGLSPEIGVKKTMNAGGVEHEKAVCTPSHDKTSRIFSVNQELVRRSFTWSFGTAIRGFSSGPPRGTTPADDRYIVLQARRNRRQKVGEIARHKIQATGRPISRFTVARRLHGGRLFARRPVRCVPLTPAHRKRRSLWCREHRNWRETMNGDESSLQRKADSRRYGSAVPFLDDNAPCHRTVAAEQLLESEDIEHMDCRHDLGSQSHQTCMGFSRQTLGSSYLTTSNDSGASIAVARRMGSNASTNH
ncbi:transposable element Tcb1 transposase [Trichonephila clavipes]|nr:transposable element Tcb1 transposase [Trichonephila clavipes]